MRPCQDAHDRPPLRASGARPPRLGGRRHSASAHCGTAGHHGRGFDGLIGAGMRTPNARHGANEGSIGPDRHGRFTQAERSARTRGALLESAARELSRHGYGNLVLEQVASDAGYARGAIALRLEFSGRDHPVGREVEKGYEQLVEYCVSLIRAGRESDAIPSGPPARTLAQAFVGALEGTTIALAGQAPYDETLAARAAAGILGLDSPS